MQIVTASHPPRSRFPALVLQTPESSRARLGDSSARLTRPPSIMPATQLSYHAKPLSLTSEMEYSSIAFLMQPLFIINAEWFIMANFVEHEKIWRGEKKLIFSDLKL